MKPAYPFTALVGQEQMQLGLVLNAISPGIGGILIRGEKGTAKSTAVRALAALLPEIEVARDCPFSCDPDVPGRFCPECRERASTNTLPKVRRRKRVVELPINATEDRVAGTLDLEHALKFGEKRFEPGLLAQANRGILYVDEVNLLDDHIVDILLDSAAMGVNTVEREGVSYSHDARFILVGTMNPEEGTLRPQLLDRFGLCIAVAGISDASQRVEIVQRWEAYEEDPVRFFKQWKAKEEEFSMRIVAAQKLMPRVRIAETLLRKIATLSVEIGVDGHRADLVMAKAAKTLAAFEGRTEVTGKDVLSVAELALYHRVRRTPFDETGVDMDLVKAVLSSDA